MKGSRVLLFVLGTVLFAASPAMALQLGVELFDIAGNVFVDRVQPGGIAAVNGVRPGDQILEVGGTRVRSVPEIRKVLSGISQGRGTTLVLLQEGVLRTIRIERSAIAMAPYRAERTDERSAVDCIRLPTIECIDAHLLQELARLAPENSVRSGLNAARAFARAGRVELAREYAKRAEKAFLAGERPLDWLNLIVLFQTYGALNLPLPSQIETEARALARSKIYIGMDISRSLREAGFVKLAGEVLREVHAKKVAEVKGQETLTIFDYGDFAREYALLGDMPNANASISDPRIPWQGQVELRMEVVKALIDAGQAKAASQQIAAAWAFFGKNAAKSMLHKDADLIRQIAIEHWRLGEIEQMEAQAGILLRMISSIKESDRSHSPVLVEALVGILGLLGRHEQALALIDEHHASATHLARARAYGRLAESMCLRHSSAVQAQSQQATMQQIVKRALNHWKHAYAAEKHWYPTYQEDIALLFRLWASSRDALPVGELTWQKGPAITAEDSQDVLESVLRGVLQGFIEAGRMADARKWAIEHRALLNNGDILDLVWAASVDGDISGAARLGNELGLSDANEQAAAAKRASLALARDFEGLARVVESADSTNVRIGVLLSLPVPVTGRCTTCID